MNLQLFAADTGADGFDDSGVDDNTDTEVADGEKEELEEEVPEEDTDESEEDSEVVEPKQSKEQDHAFAEMRRKQQETERIAKQYAAELQQRDAWVKQTFAQYGVNSWQEYQSRMEQQVKQQREKQLQDAGLDPKLINELIKNDPELQTLKQKNQELQQQMQEQQENARMVGEYNELLKEFGKDFPELNDPANIPKEVWEKYNNGYSMLDAFYVTQRGKVMEKQTAKTKQSTLNNINSKQHLKTEGDGAKDGDDVVIPKDVMATFRDMGFDKKEAQKYYKKYYK